MNLTRLVLLGLRHHRRTHAGVVLGTAVGTAVLVGALLVGDSVAATLRRQALLRIGKAEAAIVAHDRLFLADLADRLSEDVDARFAPVLMLDGIASARGGTRRANGVQVVGADARFFTFSESGGGVPVLEDGQAFLNERLARQLDVSAGDDVLLRVEQPSALPRDAVLATTEDLSLALRLKVRAVLGDEDYGRFGLAASQIPPFNLFVPLEWLQDELGVEGRANLCLTDGEGEAADAALRARWKLADAQLELRQLEGGGVELRSPRVFLDDAVDEALAGSPVELERGLTWFVNSIESGDRATPYSMVTARDGSLAEGEMAISRWLADDLGADVGSPIRLRYFVLGDQGRLVEESSDFRVESVFEMKDADPGWMPDFPGLADAEHCRDWEPGVFVDLERIGDEDEAYWDEYRGAPKAFVSLREGKRMWTTRFGALTAARGNVDFDAVLREHLDPAAIGLFFRDLRGPALAASSPSTPFGGLFLSLSFFLIAAALLLTALLFAFGVEQRASEIGALLAVGFRPADVRRVFLGEACGLALIGVVLGSLAGVGYTRAVLHGLGTLWRGAVGGTAIELAPSAGSIAMGAVGSALAALVAMRLTLRHQLRRAPTALLAARAEVAPRRRGGSLAPLLAVVCLAGALAIALAVDGSGAFFGAGSLLLVGGLAASAAVLGRLDGGLPRSVAALGRRNGARRPGRSLATVALMASGVFLVVSVGVYRLGPVDDASERASGTGGFSLFGRTTLPVLRDLETPEGRDEFALDDEELAGVGVVPLRVRAGDDASCLNLSTPGNPRLVGVRPERLEGRFAFAASLDDAGWAALEGDADGAIPAIGDQASVQWTLHRSLGDTIEYVDERGHTFDVRIVATLKNSILQGDLLISEERFKERFPTESGHRALLIGAPAERADEVAATLSGALRDVGLEVTTTAERLQAFNAVQNTYLSIFQLLGGLGLLLGSAGLGMVVLRNTLERRSELALAGALGFPRRAIRRLVLSEHVLLLVLGLACGVVPALVAVLPGARSSGGDVLPASVVVLVLAVSVSGGFWVWVATSFALRGSLLGALRNE